MDLNLGSTRALIDECRRQGLLRNQCAYVLATVYHETAHTMKPIYERGPKAYFNKYEAGTAIGKRLGNTVKGDGFKYRGRGFVQLTGRANYAKYGLVDDPDQALDPKIAASIAVKGMQSGKFTGKKLSDYLTTSKTDFMNARRIINSKDKAALIASYARDYEMDLEVLGYAKKKPAGARRVVQAPLATIEPKPSPAPTPVTDKELIKRVQTGLTLLKYNPGGADGVIGPLTAGAIRIFRSDNNLPEGDFIDDNLITALASAKPREMVPERANATTAQVAAVVPEAKVHWWTRLSAGVLGGSVGSVGLLDQITPAVGYLTPVKEFIGDVPPAIWIGGIVLVCAALYFGSQYGANKAKEAYQAGDRR